MATLSKGQAAWLALLFLVSGFAALIYQIVWQRALFTAFGVNIESITIIVAVFMFGLGVGSLVGGWLSQRFPGHLPQMFLISEAAIGLFGLVSLPLIKAVSVLTLHGSFFVIAATVYGLLCVPTIFMGATLPILSAYLHRGNRNIGKTVSTLYFVNTIGSACACFATADYLFGRFGQQGTVQIAALCNILVGVSMVASLRWLLPRAASGAVPISPTPDGVPEGSSPEPDAGGNDNGWRLAAVLILAGAVGYLALSQEMLWMRAFAYATQGLPGDFAHVLGCVLLGIALGSVFSRLVCRRRPDAALLFIAVMLGLSTVFYGVSLPLLGHLLTQPPENFGWWAALLEHLAPYSLDTPSPALAAGYAIVAVGSFFPGAVFPALCHYAVRGASGVGVPISWIYFANIVGSTAGPLFTGLVLLDVYTLEDNILFLTLFGAGLSVVVAVAAPTGRVTLAALSVLLGGCAVGLAVGHEPLYDGMLEKLHHKADYQPTGHYKYVIQGRSGIVAVLPGARADELYGGGAYDGMYNIDPINDANGVTRAHILASLHSDPEDVLVVGLASGSWVRVLMQHTGIKKITVVEINPAYLDLLEHYPDIAAIRNDPRITIEIDDGRRWLNRHPDARFDLIIMNTIYHWRGQATNLLSDDFLQLAKGHFKPDGMIFYNSTGSEDVFFTAAQVFPHVIRIGNIVGASGRPFDATPMQRRQRLLLFATEGVPVFSRTEALREKLERLSNYNIHDCGEELRSATGLWHITDDNMATEFRRRRTPPAQ